MRITRYADVNAYAARALPFLLAREAEHCLSIGLIITLQRGAASNPTPPYLALVEDDAGAVIATPLATPPHNLVLSHLAPRAELDTEETLRLIAMGAHAAVPELPGVHGPDALVGRFVEQWERLTSQPGRVFMRERLFRLEHVRPLSPIPGDMRRIEAADRPLLRDWLRAFSAEALGIPDDPEIEPLIAQSLRFESCGLYLWQVGRTAVSLAGYRGPTPHGMRLGPVYTPREARGHGYASALVADLSQCLLDEGRQFVFLFTDLANPTSNHIYQQVGYEPVSDVTVYTFQQAR